MLLCKNERELTFRKSDGLDLTLRLEVKMDFERSKADKEGGKWGNV